MMKKYIIKNLDCASCAQKIEDVLNKRNDIIECSISFANSLLVLESQNDIDIHELQVAIQKVEPDVQLEEKGKRTQLSSQHTHQEHQHEHVNCDCGHDHTHHKHDQCDCSHDHEHLDVKTHSLNRDGTISYKISGLDCASCAMKVEEAIRKMDEIEDAALNFSTETLQVKAKGNVEAEILIASLQKTVDKVEDGVTLSYKNTNRSLGKPKLFSLKENWALVLGVAVYFISILLEGQNISFFGFLISYILIGYEVIWKAIKNILRGEIFDENFLMGIATIGALVALLIFQILTPDEALSGFSNSVVIMMVGLFVVGGAIFQTGLAKMISSHILKLAGKSELKLFLLVMLVTSAIGAFVSNTGTVALMLPIVVSLAVSANMNPSRLLMPLAFASSMGGMMTLIGTPPNLVIQNALTSAGFPPLSFFSFFPVGIICVAVGTLVLLPLSKWFLSKRGKNG